MRFARQEIRGRIENDIYIIPRESFRIRLPRLSIGAVISDETSEGQTLPLTISDDLCRKFTVSQRPGFLGAQSLEEWVDTHVVDDLKRLNLKVRSQPLTTRNGMAIALHYRAPAAAPCSRSVEVNGKKIVKKRDADVGWHI